MESVVDSLCRYLRDRAEAVVFDWGLCARRGWRGRGCKALQVLAAVARYPGGEVPLTAEKLGLGPAHAKYLLYLQKRLGPVADKENAVLEAWDMVGRAFLMDLLALIKKRL
jgi:hypothetical protein